MLIAPSSSPLNESYPEPDGDWAPAEPEPAGPEVEEVVPELVLVTPNPPALDEDPAPPAVLVVDGFTEDEELQMVG